MEPALAGVSRQQQRVRIMFHLEAPIPPAAAQQDDLPGRPAGATPAERRIQALQDQIQATQDPERRFALLDELRQLVAAQRAADGS